MSERFCLRFDIPDFDSEGHFTALKSRTTMATRHLNPGIWAEESSCGIKLPEFETLVALKSRTARQSERGEGPTFSFVMKKGRSIASAKCDWPEAARRKYAEWLDVLHARLEFRRLTEDSNECEQ
jgi:hypothetical protein